MTGRQLARVNTVKYGETLWSELYPGNQHTVNCLQPAVTATESSLELAQAQRQRTVWRFDGGAGSDEQFQWLFNRGYHVVGKGLSNFRACALAQQVRRWDSYADCQLGEVTPPLITVALCAFSSNADSKRTNGGTATTLLHSNFLPKGCS